MEVSKHPMPARVEAALPELVADIIDYLALDECEQFSSDDLSLVGYFVSGSKAFLVYEYMSDGEPGIAAILMNQNSKSFDDASVFSWGRDEGQSTEDALSIFLQMHPRLWGSVDRPQLIRRLRIAASVFFAVVAVALCVLWVRSYWLADVLALRLGDRSLLAHSLDGEVLILAGPRFVETGWSVPTAEQVRTPTPLVSPSVFGLSIGKAQGKYYFTACNWLLISISISIAFASWQPFNFSLRTLLIATTLVAVVLGLGVWAAEWVKVRLAVRTVDSE
jgi:hypothetical protein